MRHYDSDRPGYGLAQLAAVSDEMTGRGSVAQVAAVPVDGAMTREVRRAAPRAVYRDGGKRLFETLIIALSLPFFLPVIALCSLALWIEGGNPFYRQTRLGRNGKTFSILKLRTMVFNADAVLEAHLASDPEMRREWDEKQKLVNDPRVTVVGRVLRSTSLDELPQLWNVLKGEMSLIGPRPMMPDQLPLYGNPAHYFALRPGITGLWQISARNESSFAARNEIDATYGRRMSLRNDIAIIFKTISVMARRTGC